MIKGPTLMLILTLITLNQNNINNFNTKHQKERNNTKKNFNVGFINVGGLTQEKLSEKLITADKYGIDIIGILETWLIDKILKFDQNIDKLQIFKKGLPVTNSYRGQQGIIVLTKEKINMTNIKIFNQLVSFTLGKTNICLCYKPFSIDLYLEDFKFFFNNDTNIDKYYNLIIAGDFNIELPSAKNERERLKILDFGVKKQILPLYTFKKNNKKITTSPDEIYSKITAPSSVMESNFDHNYVTFKIDNDMFYNNTKLVAPSNKKSIDKKMTTRCSKAVVLKGGPGAPFGP